MIAKSIRWRFVLWLAFLLVGILIGFGVTAYQLSRLNRFRQIDEELERRVAALNGDVRMPPPFMGRPPLEPRPGEMGEPPDNAGPPPLNRDRSRSPRRGPDFSMPRGSPESWLNSRDIQLSPRTANLFDQTETNGYYFAVWSRAGNLLKYSTNVSDVPLPNRPDAGTGIHLRTRDLRREAFQFTEIGECLLAGRPITADLRALQLFAWWLVAAGGTVLALGLGGAWVLVSRAIHPVEAISTAASRISAGHLAERINVADTDSELGRLAGVLNSTFARLESAFAQQKQFTADASHELRTPLAVMISEAQTTLTRNRTEAEYRETIATFLDTAQQMRRLTESLLELARFDAGQENLQHERLDLADCARAAVELVHPLADERGLAIRCDLTPAEAPGDAQRLGQVITNLLTNAIHYNQAGGEVRIATSSGNGFAILAVTDTGPGIAPENVPHLFKRFYRADKSRTRANGRSGLGLAICKAIVDAHGGSLEVDSVLGKGTTFTVRLPAAEAASTS